MAQNDSKITIIGLTGNSGSGKSLVADICADHGAYIINADKVNHENMSAGKPAYTEIIREFGTDILDENGAIDRRKLGDIVFAHKDKLKVLVDITHKHVKEETYRRIAQVKGDPGRHKFIIVDAPLLIEASLHHNCDETWIVTADHNTRLQRIRQRDQISDLQIEKRFASATPQSELAKYANVVIENNYVNLEPLECHVKSLLLERGLIKRG